MFTSGAQKLSLEMICLSATLLMPRKDLWVRFSGAWRFMDTWEAEVREESWGRGGRSGIEGQEARKGGQRGHNKEGTGCATPGFTSSLGSLHYTWLSEVVM